MSINDDDNVMTIPLVLPRGKNIQIEIFTVGNGRKIASEKVVLLTRLLMYLLTRCTPLYCCTGFERRNWTFGRECTPLTDIGSDTIPIVPVRKVYFLFISS